MTDKPSIGRPPGRKITQIEADRAYRKRRADRLSAVAKLEEELRRYREIYGELPIL